MFHRDHCDYRHVESFGFERHIHNDFVHTAVGEQQKAVGFTKHKVAQDHLTEAFHMLEEHCLTLSVRTHDQVVKGKRELHNGMKAGETAVTREHLLHEDAG